MNRDSSAGRQGGLLARACGPGSRLCLSPSGILRHLARSSPAPDWLRGGNHTHLKDSRRLLPGRGTFSCRTTPVK